MKIFKFISFVVMSGLLSMPIMAEESSQANPESSTPAARLLFHATFDGTTKALTSGGDANASITNGLAFAPGHREQALRLPRGSNHALVYSAAGNLVAERGTVFCWVRTDWKDRPHDEWRQLAVAWDAKGPQVYLDGRPADPNTLPFALTDILAFPNSPKKFLVGGIGEKLPYNLFIDELRIYSAPLDAKQIREFVRSEIVAEITLKETALFADRRASLTVKATSPAALDLSELKYCIHTHDGKPIVTFRNPVESGSVKLPVNLPAGDYVLRLTDDDWFYGCAPFTVRPAGEAPPVAKQKPQPTGGLRRFWHDINSFDFENMRRK